MTPAATSDRGQRNKARFEEMRARDAEAKWQDSAAEDRGATVDGRNADSEAMEERAAGRCEACGENARERWVNVTETDGTLRCRMGICSGCAKQITVDDVEQYGF